MAWEYQREEQKYEVLPVGDYRIRVKSAELVQSNSGRDMISLQFDVSGFPGTLYHYIVFLEDRPEITNRNLTQFFDSFPGIKEGDLKNLSSWTGKIGACIVKHDEYNGKVSAKVARFIPASKQDTLPPWKEVGTTKSGAKVDKDGFIEIDLDSTTPFDF